MVNSISFNGSSFFSFGNAVGEKGGREKEADPSERFYPLSQLEESGVSVKLYGDLIESGVISQTGQYVGRNGARALPPLKNDAVALLMAELSRSFVIKNREGRELRRTSIGDLLLRFMKNIPDSYEVTDINLIGGYLNHLFTLSPGYMEDLFGGDFSDTVKARFRTALKSNPSDIDIRIKVRHKEFGDLISKSELRKDIIEGSFLRDIGTCDDILFKKWAQIDNGLNLFSIIMLDGTNIELIFYVKALRDHLFSIDSYYLPIKEALRGTDAALTPVSYWDSPRQGIIDSALSVLRAKDVGGIDIDGFFRLISKLVKGMGSIQKGLSAALANKLLRKKDSAYYLKKIRETLNNHHDLNPNEIFAYMFNFTCFLKMSDDDAASLWKNFYKDFKRPRFAWAKEIVEQAVESNRGFSRIVADLHTCLYLCRVSEWEGEMNIEVARYEEGEAFKINLEGAFLWLLYDSSLEIEVSDDLLTLLREMFVEKKGSPQRGKNFIFFRNYLDLGLLESLTKKEATMRLRVLLSQIKFSEKQTAIDRAARIAHFIMERDIKSDAFISQELVGLICKTGDQKLARDLMVLGTTRDIIKRGSSERSEGWFHFLQEYWKKHGDPKAILERYKKMWRKKEISVSPEITEFFMQIFEQVVEERSFKEAAGWISGFPLSDDRRAELFVATVRKRLDKGDIEEALNALEAVPQKKDTLLEDFVKYLEKDNKREESDFAVVGQLLESCEELPAETFSLLTSRMMEAGGKMSWKPERGLIKRYMVAVLEGFFFPRPFLLDKIAEIIEEMRSVTSPYSAIRGEIEKALPKFMEHIDEADYQYCERLLRAVEKTFFTYNWGSGERIKVNAIWAVIGQKALAEERVEQVVESARKVEDRCDFLPLAAEFLLRKDRIDEAIEIFEKNYRLDPNSLERTWEGYEKCLKKVKSPLQLCRLVAASPIFAAAGKRVKNILKDLLRVSKNNRRLMLCVFDFLKKFNHLFGTGDEGLLLDYLEGLCRLCPEKSREAFYLLDPLLARDSDTDQKALALILPVLLQEKDAFIFQFITGERKLAVSDIETVRRIDRIALEIAESRSTSERKAVLEALGAKNRLSFRGKIMLIDDCFASSKEEEAQKSVRMIADLVRNEQREIGKFFSVPSNCRQFMNRLLNLRKLPVKVILQLMRLIEDTKLKEIDFEPLITFWVVEKDNIELDDVELLTLLSVFEIAQIRGKDIVERNMGVLFNFIVEFANKKKGILKDSDFLHSILRVYQQLSRKISSLKLHADDFFWKVVHSAINPFVSRDFLVLFELYFDFITEMLRKREVIGKAQQAVIYEMTGNLPLLLNKGGNCQGKIYLLNLLKEFDEKSDDSNALFEWLTNFVSSTYCSNSLVNEGVFYYASFVLEKLIIPNYCDRVDKLIALIENYLQRCPAMRGGRNLSEEELKTYLGLYKALFENCVAHKESLELFRKICSQFCSLPQGMKEIDIYCCPEHNRSRLPKRKVLSILFDTMFNHFIAANPADLSTRDIEYRKVGLLISFLCEIFNQGWFVQKIEIPITMVQLILPYLASFFACEGQGYDGEMDPVLELVHMVDRAEKYLLSAEIGKKNIHMSLPKSLAERSKEGKIPVKEIIEVYKKDVSQVVSAWIKEVNSVSGIVDNRQAQELADKALPGLLKASEEYLRYSGC